MKVKSLAIKNLKSYPEAELELSPGINLLIGANNSGKSTIIRALLNLQYNNLDKKDIRINETTAKILIKLSDIDEGDVKRFENPRTHDSVKHSDAMDVYWQVGMTPSGQHNEEHYYAPSGTKEWNLSGVKAKPNPDQRGPEYHDFHRFPDKVNKSNFIFPFLSKRKTDFYDTQGNQDQAFKIEDGMRNLAARLQRFDSSSSPRNKRFVSLCEEILGFTVGVIPIEHQNISGYEPGMFVTDTTMIPIKSMGEGVANIIGCIVTLLSEDNKLVLIEELENDIHPAALKKLLGLIKEKSKNNQFVISTHSHIVLKYLGAVEGSKIFFTNAINDYKRKRIPTSEITPIENEPKSRIQLLNKLGYEFHDFELFEAYLILEESSAESVIRDFLILNFVPELYGRLRTIAAQGVDDLDARVSDFNRLFVFIHTSEVYAGKAWVMADGDTAGKKCVAALKKKFKSWPEDHFLNLSKSNFEEYYPKKFQKDVEAAFAQQGEAKQTAKRELVGRVMDWALNNREEAITEFKKSASEVIKLLQSINQQLNNRQKKQ